MNKKILIVEDNEMNRDMLSRRLIKRGFQISMAVTGKEAVEAVGNNSPDLVLMDMDLPVMDGWQATRILKSDDSTKNIPVIALTAHAMFGDEQKAKDAGCDDYETKPIDLNKLLDKIHKHLGS